MADVRTLAEQQRAYERKMQALAMHRQGMSYPAIGRHFGVSANRARSLANHALRFRMSPVEAHRLNRINPEPLITPARVHHSWLSAQLHRCENWDLIDG